MRKSEEAIEKVLEGLRSSEPAEGMERRILASVEVRAAAQSASRWRGLKPVWLVMPVRLVSGWSVACGVAFVGVIGAALVMPAIQRPGHGPDQSRAQAKMNAAVAASLPRVASGVAAEGTQPLPPETRARSFRRTKARGESLVSDSDAAALHEMRAASYPAPPMPLTEQEKLLLRVVHQGDPVEVAMLNPEMRAKQDAEGKAEFQKFFGQSTTGYSK